MSKTTLFDNIPQTQDDYLSLFGSGKLNYQKVVELLEFKKKDVAKASNVPEESVRYDQRMPKELADRLMEWAIALAAVGRYFKNSDKTVLWFKIPNPLLGNVTPREMIRVGRFNKLHRFIQNALDENER